MRKSNRQWNQGMLSETPFAMRRQKATYSLEIKTSAKKVFEQACQAGQPGWISQEIESLVEPNDAKKGNMTTWYENETAETLFRNRELPTYWTTTLFDPVNYQYQAVMINPDLAIGTFVFDIIERGRITVVSFDLTYTVLSETGSVLFDDEIELRMQLLLERFGQNVRNSIRAGSTAQVKAVSSWKQSRIVEHETVIDGEIDDIFALVCPVAELLWIDDWKFNLVYSESGKNETGCIFSEASTATGIMHLPGVKNHWYTTRYDCENHQFHAIWTTRNLCIAHWEFSLTDLGNGNTRANWKLRYTALEVQGSDIIKESDFELRMKGALVFLATSLKQYVENQTIFRIPLLRKLKIIASVIGASLTRHFRRGHAQSSKRIMGRTKLRLE